MTLACRLQAVEQAQKQFKTVKNASIAHIPNRDNCEEPGNSCAVASFTSTEKLSSQVEQLTKMVAELMMRSKEHRKPPQRRQMKCWTCRQAGHLQCDCLLRKPGVQQRKGAMGYTSAVACTLKVNGFVEGHPISSALSSFEQRQLQLSDHDLKQVLMWMEKDQCPTEFPKNSGYWVQTLWSQHAHLVVKEGCFSENGRMCQGKVQTNACSLLFPGYGSFHIATAS